MDNPLKIVNTAEKHRKYQMFYKPNIVYWGLGIENELYLEFDQKIKIPMSFFEKNHRRERYSIDYFANYKSSVLARAFDEFNKFVPAVGIGDLELPILINSHSFTHGDQSNQPETLYTSRLIRNPKFSGTVLIDFLKKSDTYFANTMDLNWLFDGDTIEFTTLNFFNGNLPAIIDELEKSKMEFIKHINDSFQREKLFETYGPVKIMELNHDFAIHLTNLDNISMFNNGTLHYNITLPTKLDSNAEIVDFQSFTKTHQLAIKYIQWLEPLLIAVYGSPDPFSKLSTTFLNKRAFSASSQRCAVSRYISIGTYDSDEMVRGKYLTEKISNLKLNHCDHWWYTNYHKHSAYSTLIELGLDINFNKHYNHGIELRFFDHITDSNKIKESFEFIIYLMDFVLDKFITIINPIYEKSWNNLVIGTLTYGRDYALTVGEKNQFDKLFGVVFTNNIAGHLYNEIYEYLVSSYGKKYKRNNVYYRKPIGPFSSLVLTTEIIGNIKLNRNSVSKYILATKKAIKNYFK